MESSSPPLLSTLLFIALSFVLVALNAFFVSAEFAIVKVRRTRLEELAGEGVARARVSLLCVENLDESLSATQLGITLVSLALGWIGEEAFYNFLVILFPAASLGHRGPSHVIAAVLSFFVITLLHVVLGELVPKSLAIQRAEPVVLAVAKPLYFFYRLAKPLIVAFATLANGCLRLLGLGEDREAPMSEQELKMVLEESHDEGVISTAEAQIIQQAFEFSDKRAGEIMVPPSRVYYLSLSRPFEQNLLMTRQRMFTRFPLARDDFSTVIGVVHMKDALHAMDDSSDNSIFERTARPPVYIDPGMRQDQMMRIMRERRTHLLIVRDPRTQRNLGIVTMEDILEHLFGQIQDEHGH